MKNLSQYITESKTWADGYGEFVDNYLDNHYLHGGEPEESPKELKSMMSDIVGEIIQELEKQYKFTANQETLKHVSMIVRDQIGGL